MIDESLQERSALYASGAMTAEERDEFEMILEFHDELRQFSTGLLDVATAITLATIPKGTPSPSEALKGRILDAIANRAQVRTPEGYVMTGPDGLVMWVNPAFSEMCGYPLTELRGKKLGPILQGEKTDRATALRMKNAVNEKRTCRETILNYHKDGSFYWVEINITPILDDVGEPLWFFAREREVAEPLAA